MHTFGKALLNTDLLPTKNTSHLGCIPQTIAGAPSHLVVSLTDDAGSDNILPNSLKKFIALNPPCFP